MREPEYKEGPKATENFERGMTALFKVPKVAVERAKRKAKPAASRKPKQSDKG